MSTDTEQNRHRCEVRHCIKQGRAWFVEYAAGVKAKRGAEAAKRLWDDVKQQAGLGNTGAPGDWREAKAEERIEA